MKTKRCKSCGAEMSAYSSLREVDRELVTKIKLWRLEKGISQQRLAQRCGVSRFTLSLIENGYRGVSAREADIIKKTINDR